MSDETKRFDPLGEDNEIDELIRSTREEIERMEEAYKTILKEDKTKV